MAEFSSKYTVLETHFKSEAYFFGRIVETQTQDSYLAEIYRAHQGRTAHDRASSAKKLLDRLPRAEHFLQYQGPEDHIDIVILKSEIVGTLVPITSLAFQELTFAQKKRIVESLCLAVIDIHSSQLAHNAIHARSILVDPDTCNVTLTNYYRLSRAVSILPRSRPTSGQEPERGEASSESSGYHASYSKDLADVGRIVRSLFSNDEFPSLDRVIARAVANDSQKPYRSIHELSRNLNYAFDIQLTQEEGIPAFPGRNILHYSEQHQEILNQAYSSALAKEKVAVVISGESKYREDNPNSKCEKYVFPMRSKVCV